MINCLQCILKVDSVNVMPFIVNYVEHIFEFLSLGVALVYYNRIRYSFMKWFLPFLLTITIGEIFAVRDYLGFYITYLLATLESFFYCYIFYTLIDNISIKKTITFLTVIVIIGFVIGFLFIDVSRRYMFFFMKVRIAAGVLTTFYALFYLYARFLREEKQKLTQDPGFWIAFGIIMYSSGLSWIFSLYFVVVEQRLILFGEPLYRLIPRLLCVILYSSLAASIILYVKNNKKASYS
jgi:hypothetical protein